MKAHTVLREGFASFVEWCPDPAKTLRCDGMLHHRVDFLVVKTVGNWNSGVEAEGNLTMSSSREQRSVGVVGTGLSKADVVTEADTHWLGYCYARKVDSTQQVIKLSWDLSLTLSLLHLGSMEEEAKQLVLPGLEIVSAVIIVVQGSPQKGTVEQRHTNCLRPLGRPQLC